VKVWCATGNPGKLREFQLAGKVLGIDIAPLENLKSLPAPEETGATFEENARLKAEYYSRFAPGPLFADDSGLEADALHGEPGVRSARYAGENATDEANNRLLLARIRDQQNRTARFVCVIALARAGETIATFRGEVEGVIIDFPRGANGFGYDPLFHYPPFGCTFAEIEGERKFDVSHRGQALRKMLAWLTTESSALKTGK
jgi:XTP/dITP diphosphohydrolase